MKQHDLLIDTHGGVPETSPRKDNLYQKIRGRLPKKKGTYITNHGELYFNGKTFVMNGERRFATTVEWYMVPFIDLTGLAEPQK